jgi:hypothetical protein
LTGINIVQEDITKMTVDIIVCPQDENCLSKGGIAKAISKVSDEWYRRALLGMKRVSKCFNCFSNVLLSLTACLSHRGATV